MLGIDSAGKTTILYKIKLGEVVSSVPCIGFNFETVEYKKIKLICWDMELNRIRPFFKPYFQDTQGLIFVVDSSDRERIEMAKEDLHRVLANEQLKDAPLLVFANKQDLDAMSVTEITKKLGLHTLQGRDWYIQGTCARSGDGLYEGFEWLCKTLAKRN